MDNRLKTIASYIDRGVGFADVGTDHGYIPAELALSGYSGNIIATDINASPLQTAVATAKGAGVEDKIEFLLCDGLTLCSPEKIDTIVIAGMGGDMICHILDSAFWCLDRKYKLILQPMTKAEVVRYWLSYNGFEIECEDLSADGDTVYQIIVARFGGETKFTDAELFTGKKRLCRNNRLFDKRIETLIKTFNAALCGMERAESGSQTGRLRLYRNILLELKEMRNENGNCQ